MKFFFSIIFLLNTLIVISQTNQQFLTIIEQVRKYDKSKLRDSSNYYYKKLFTLEPGQLHDTLKLRLADSYMLMANREKASDNVKTAASYLLKARDIIPKTDTIRILRSKYISVEINRAIKNFDASKTELREIIRLCLTANYKGKYFYDSYLTMGAIFLEELSDIDSSIYYANKALPFILAANDSTVLAKCFNNVAVAYHRKHKLNEALVYYQKALKIDSLKKNYYGELLSRGNVAQIYCDQKKYKEAIAYSDRTFNLFHSQEFGSIKADLYLVKARSYLHTQQPDSSEKYFENFFSLTQELYQSEQNVMINELNTKYQTEQREKDILLLKENSELQEKESRSKQLIIYFFIGFSILLIFTIYLSVKSFLNKKKDNQIITLQKKEVENQKEVIEIHQKEIVDSINYAKRIQYSLLAPESILKSNLESHFVLFKPKDIVSGDFYWATEHNHKFYLAVCDSTGHGVPGAFMSLLNIGFLSEAIKEKEISEPHEVFNYTRKRLIESISKEDQQDGMDGILLCLDKTGNTVSYAAANNNPILIRDNMLMHLPKDKMPVGKGERIESFKLHTIDVQKGDTVYLYTDGYADQFGGPKSKKFKYKQLEDVLISVCNLPMIEQMAILKEKFEGWKGNLEQVDDVLVIGIKI